MSNCNFEILDIQQAANVNDLTHPGAEDYYAVMDDAIEWIRQEVKDLREGANKSLI